MGQILVFTGAGLSAESGISTFRDNADGLWAKYFTKTYGYRTPNSWVKDSNGDCSMTKETLSEEDKIKLDSTIANIVKKPIT